MAPGVVVGPDVACQGVAPGQTDPEPGQPAAQPVVCVVKVQRVVSTTTSDLLCPVCQASDARVLAARAAVPQDQYPVVCTREWLRGQELDIGDKFHDEVCECFVTTPFPAGDWPDKSNSERRYFLYQTCAWALGVTGPGVRARHTRCVQDEIADRYGASEVGFRAA